MSEASDIQDEEVCRALGLTLFGPKDEELNPFECSTTGELAWPNVTTDIYAAWFIVQALQRRGWSVEMHAFHDGSAHKKRFRVHVCQFDSQGVFKMKTADEDTMPLAICIAALKLYQPGQAGQPRKRKAEE